MLKILKKKPTLQVEWENCYEKEIGVKHQLIQIYKYFGM